MSVPLVYSSIRKPQTVGWSSVLALCSRSFLVRPAQVEKIENVCSLFALPVCRAFFMPAGVHRKLATIT